MAENGRAGGYRRVHHFGSRQRPAETGRSPVSTERFRFAQGEVRELPVGYTWIRFAGKELMTQVIFNAEGTSPLLGALALEAAYVAVDPVGQRLIPVDGLLMAGSSP